MAELAVPQLQWTLDLKAEDKRVRNKEIFGTLMEVFEQLGATFRKRVAWKKLKKFHTLPQNAFLMYNVMSQIKRITNLLLF